VELLLLVFFYDLDWNNDWKFLASDFYCGAFAFSVFLYFRVFLGF
jgi:hypothetical protein